MTIGSIASMVVTVKHSNWWIQIYH